MSKGEKDRVERHRGSFKLGYRGTISENNGKIKRKRRAVRLTPPTAGTRRADEKRQCRGRHPGTGQSGRGGEMKKNGSA